MQIESSIQILSRVVRAAKQVLLTFDYVFSRIGAVHPEVAEKYNSAQQSINEINDALFRAEVSDVGRKTPDGQ